MNKENNTLQDWEVRIRPLRNKQCLREQCAWWLKETSKCAVTKIAAS